MARYSTLLLCALCRELQESLFYDKAAAVDEDAGEIRLRPGGGRLPGADRLPAASAAKAIPTGPPGVAQPPPRDGGPSSWKDDSWRSPFKGGPPVVYPVLGHF